MRNFLRINEKDNVVVALQDILPGETEVMSIAVPEKIPAGHKMAVCDISAGSEIIKYGYPIGIAREDIKAGEWVHTHNIKTALGDLLEYSYHPVFAEEGEGSRGREARGDADGQEHKEEADKGADEGSYYGDVFQNSAYSHVSSMHQGGMSPNRESMHQKDTTPERGSVHQGDMSPERGSVHQGNMSPERGSVHQGDTSPERGSMFQGFVRSDGSVGVRNEIWIIPTVGCVNNTAAAIARQAGACVRGTVDEVIAFSHPYGCSQMGDDQENTRKILADLIRHPNAGGVLVLGLGCENSNINVLKPYIGDYDEKRVKFLTAQECEDEIAEGVKLVRELIAYGASFERQPVNADKLIVGMKCGGSDGFSGITANPLVGRFSDRLVAEGGTTILTEVPEMFGAETILMNRCANEELFRKTVSLINDFKQYFKSHNQTIYENPSPGNKAGGISTLEDKSLGCTQKSGSGPVRGVLQYGERVKNKGLNLLGAPGNDLVASTALAAAGAQIVLFTTGRGTPFASPVPTVKISSNSGLAGRKANWIDFDAGVLAEGGDEEQETDRLYQYVLKVASGRKVCSEKAGYYDMAIWKGGVTL